MKYKSIGYNLKLENKFAKINVGIIMTDVNV